MPEDQEQKSQSEDSKDEPTIVSPLATPYRALISVKQEDLKRRFDAHWSIYKDSLIKKYSVRARSTKMARKMVEARVGRTNLYSDQLLDVIFNRFDKEDIRALHIEKIDLHNFMDENMSLATIVVIYYPFPELKFNGEVNWEIERPVKYANLEDGWENRKAALLQRHSSGEKKVTWTDVLKEEGFETEEDMQKDFNEQYSQFVKNTEVSHVFDNLISQITVQSELPSLPQNYMDERVNQLVTEHFAHFDGDKKKGLEVLGATDETQARKKFTGHVVKELINQMALTELAKWGDVPSKDHQALQEFVMNKVLWKDPAKGA